MATEATLKAEIREGRGKGLARRLRAAGRIPAVIYGRGVQDRSLSVDALEVERLFSRISVENTVINLDVEGTTVPVLVREVQSHPFKPQILHVDFYQVRAGEKVSVQIPLQLTGTPEGVKAGGVLDVTLHEVAVRCVPSAIPESIEVDVSGLQIGDALHVGDISMPKGVELETDAATTVCTVSVPTVAALGTESEAPEGVGGEVTPELIRDRGEEQATQAPSEGD